jgi:hypothetical protein
LIGVCHSGPLLEPDVGNNPTHGPNRGVGEVPPPALKGLLTDHGAAINFEAALSAATLADFDMTGGRQVYEKA